MKTIKRILLLCLIVLVVVAGVQIRGGYDKYKDALEFYVNGIYYGSGYYNIYDASMGYFGKEPKDMTDYECTLLVEYQMHRLYIRSM